MSLDSEIKNGKTTLNNNFFFLGCATLIKLNGNPEIIEDRIAFIEKSPRICINKKWFCGPKGDGHECGAYEPSRSLVLTTLLKFNDLNEKKSEKLVTR